jgi:hypothetical protein
VFGGGDGRVLLNDVWTLDWLPSSHAQRDAWSCSWQCQKCAGDAASRMGHNLVYMASQKALLSADALRKFPLVKGDRVVITRNPHTIKLAHIKATRFTDRLVAKFKLPVEGWRGE